MALAVDAVNTGTGNPNVTISHTCTGATLAIYNLTGQRYDTSGLTGVTYNALAMTQLASQGSGNLSLSAIHRQLGPATGAHNVVTAQADSRPLACTSISFTGVDQTTPEGTPGLATGHDTTPTVTVSSAAGEIVLAVCSWYMPAAETMAVGASQTQRSNQTNSTMGVIVSTKAGAASVTMDYTASASVYWNLIAIPIKPGGAGGGGSPLGVPLMMLMGDGG